MGAWRFWWQGSRRFYQHWGSYVALIFGTNLGISYLAIPFFNWALEMLLKSQGVAYVSYTNAGTILIHHPVAAIGMLAILLAIIILVYWQFAFLLLGIMNIFRGRQQTVRGVLRDTVSSLHDTSIGNFFIFYFIFPSDFAIWEFYVYHPTAQQSPDSRLHCQLLARQSLDGTGIRRILRCRGLCRDSFDEHVTPHDYRPFTLANRR